jgi:hypothetical protein
MYRVVLATGLMVVQLAAPLLCCCRFAHQATASTPVAATTLADPPVKSCCAHHRSDVASKLADPHASNPRPASVPSDCPCRQETKRPILSLTPEAVKVADGRSLSPILSAAWSGAATSAMPLTGLPCLAIDHRVSMPFLSADDLLCSHHLLRC